jgi:hypothetical protein
LRRHFKDQISVQKLFTINLVKRKFVLIFVVN